MRRKNKHPYFYFVPLMLVIFTSLGALLGYLFKNISLGVCLGMLIGSLVGSYLMKYKAFKHENKHDK